MEKGKRNIIPMFVAVLILGVAHGMSDQRGNATDVVKITAQKFEYKPSRITLKTGEPVTLELISLDRIHGFSIPDLGLRADVLPGQSVQVEILPENAGTYLFLCDIFCGDGHGEMSGIIIVSD